jgi:hypothetical protein
MVDSDPVEASVVTSALGAESAAGAALGASAAAGDESSDVTVFGSSACSGVLPPAVTRSVSVTDFLSFPR